jgi:uncharacterized protein (DUF4415 family)
MDFARFRPAEEVLPASVIAKLRVRGPKKTPTNGLTTIRLSKGVLEALRATGAGWRTRMSKALQEWVRTHSPVWPCLGGVGAIEGKRG